MLATAQRTIRAQDPSHPAALHIGAYEADRDPRARPAGLVQRDRPSTRVRSASPPIFVPRLARGVGKQPHPDQLVAARLDGAASDVRRTRQTDERSLVNRYRLLYDPRVEELRDVAAAIRQIARGFEALADSIARSPDQPESARTAALLRDWGDRGLTRSEASALFRRHGFAPQTAGGWTRGDWIQTRPDGRRYITDRSRAWLAGQEDADRG